MSTSVKDETVPQASAGSSEIDSTTSSLVMSTSDVEDETVAEVFATEVGWMDTRPPGEDDGETGAVPAASDSIDRGAAAPIPRASDAVLPFSVGLSTGAWSMGDLDNSSNSTRLQSAQHLMDCDDYEEMITAIVGKNPATLASSNRVSRDVIIPDTAERLRASKKVSRQKLRFASDNSDEALGVIHTQPHPDVNEDALPSSTASSFHNDYGMVSTMQQPVIRTSVRLVKSILLTPARRLERDEVKNMKPVPRVHFKIARSPDGLYLQPLELGSVYIKRWLLLMVLPITWEIWSFPFRLAFGDIEAGDNMWVLTVDGIADFMFICDIIVSFVTIIPASTFPNQPDVANTFESIKALRVRHELFWYLYIICACVCVCVCMCVRACVCFGVFSRACIHIDLTMSFVHSVSSIISSFFPAHTSNCPCCE